MNVPRDVLDQSNGFALDFGELCFPKVTLLVFRVRCGNKLLFVFMTYLNTHSRSS